MPGQALRPLQGQRGPSHPLQLLADPHFLGALAAAVPVWGALALGVAGPLYRPADVLTWIGFVCLQPLAEELAFRGALQGQLLRILGCRRIAGLTLANIVTTSTFVTLHLAVQPPAWALIVAAPSLVFGHLRERLGRLWPVVLLHALYNAGFAVAAQHAG